MALISHTTTGRFPEVDVIKAVAIVSVVLIHSIRSPWDPNAHRFDIWLNHATSFAVPAFVAVSGFLWAVEGRQAALATVSRRLRRLLVPYICVSLLVHAVRSLHDGPGSSGALIRALLIGSTYYPYYYVFVAVLFVFALPIFGAMPRKSQIPITIGLIGATLISQGLVGPDSPYRLPVDWYLRNPFLFAGYFAVGWVVRLRGAELRPRISDRHRLVTLILGTAVVVCLLVVAMPLPSQAVMAAHWEYHYAAIALLFVYGCSIARINALVGTLSNATYAIFLLHPAFIDAANILLTHGGLSSAVAVSGIRFSSGLFGSFFVVAIVRRFLPRHSRDLIGA